MQFYLAKICFGTRRNDWNDLDKYSTICTLRGDATLPKLVNPLQNFTQVSIEYVVSFLPSTIETMGTKFANPPKV